VVNSVEEKEQKLKNIDYKKKAIIGLNKLTTEQKRNILAWLNGVSVKMSDADVEIALDELVEKEAKHVLEAMDVDKEELALTSLVYKAISLGILVSDSALGVKYKQDVLASSIPEMVKYLKDPKNSKFHAFLITLINERL